MVVHSSSVQVIASQNPSQVPPLLMHGGSDQLHCWPPRGWHKFLVDTCPFLGPLVPLIWITGDVSSSSRSRKFGEGGPRNMKYKPLRMAAILFGLFLQARGGGQGGRYCSSGFQSQSGFCLICFFAEVNVMYIS